MLTRSRIVLFALTLPVIASAQTTRAVRPAARPALIQGFSAERLARIDSTIQRYVDRGEVAGAVALVWRDGRPVYEKAFGMADREAGRRMTTDALFRIASQTKALTSVAVMQLVEEGKVALHDRVSRFIPAFEKTTVALPADSGRAPVAARRQVTIRDLLTHTAGISYGTEPWVAERYRAAGLGPAAGFGWYTADKGEPVCATMERLPTLPFVAQPGERWVYGYATDVLGCVVERASGMPLDEYVRTRITGPLGMNDTWFFVPPAAASRLTAVYTRGTDGRLERAPDGPRGQGDYAVGPRRSFSGGAGLVSTARDYARFLQALLDGGALGSTRILAPSTVRLMASNQTGSLFPTPGQGFGLGFEITEQPGANGSPTSVGTYGWGGAYGSQYLVDPAEGLVLVFMVQDLPNRTDLGRRFPMLVYQALVEPRRAAGR